MIGALHMSVGALAAICAICTFSATGVVGVVFRGAALAWKSERDAAVDKADRLEQKVNEQADQIKTLQAKVEDLEEHSAGQVAAATDRLAQHMISEHRDQTAVLVRLVSVIERLDTTVHANTAATEVVARGAVIKDALNEHDNEAAA